MSKLLYNLNKHQFRILLGCLIGLFFTVFCATSTVSILNNLVKQYDIPMWASIWVGQIPKITTLSTCFLAVVLANRYGKVVIAKAGLFCMTVSFIPLIISNNLFMLITTKYLASIGGALLGASLFSIVMDISREDNAIQLFALSLLMLHFGNEF